MTTETLSRDGNRGLVFSSAGIGGNRVKPTPHSPGGQSFPDSVPVESKTSLLSDRPVNRADTTLDKADLKAEAARRERTFVPTRPTSESAHLISGLEKWEGHVLSLDEHTFTAELWPLSAASEAVVVADFDRALIAEGDLELLVVGGTFYCTVRTVRGPGGQPFRTSSLRMRRLGLWSEDTLSRIQEQARRKAARLAELTE